jgi:hypothetical protein
VAARSKAWVCCRLVAGVVGSNPARDKDVCLLCLYVVLSCVGRVLCVGLITRPEESYRVSKYVCDHGNPERGPMFQIGNKRKMNELCNLKYVCRFNDRNVLLFIGLWLEVVSG